MRYVVMAAVFMAMCAYAQPQEEITPNFYVGVSDPGSCQPNLSNPVPVFFYRRDINQFALCMSDGTLQHVALGSTAPSGPAGGDLSGTFPNPSVAALHLSAPSYSAASVTVASTDSFIRCAPTSGGLGNNVNLALPPATGSGRLLIIKDTASSTHNCIVTPNGGDTIDGSNTPISWNTRYQTLSIVDSSSGAWSIFPIDPPLSGDLSFISGTTYHVGSLNGQPFGYTIPTPKACGTTSSCSFGTQTNAFMLYGSAPLVSGMPSAVTITGLGFTSISSYMCSATISGATPVALSVANVDGTSFTITGPDTTTTPVNYVCMGI